MCLLEGASLSTVVTFKSYYHTYAGHPVRLGEIQAFVFMVGQIAILGFFCGSFQFWEEYFVLMSLLQI